MATDVGLNEGEVWRAVVTYRDRKSNPEATWDNRTSVPRYLDTWAEETRTKVRGPYSSPTTARVQAGRDASELANEWGWQLNERIKTKRVVSVAIERTSLAWEEVDVRDPEKGWGG